MDIVTLDFETYYSKDYGLGKMTTEEYVRHDKFEVIGVSVKVNDGPTDWFSGTMEGTRTFLNSLDYTNKAILCHNTAFDGLILSEHFGIKPKFWFDTMSMAKPTHSVTAGGSLKNLVLNFGLGEKGTEVIDALGKRRKDFTPTDLAQYGDYCINDTELTYKLFKELKKGFPVSELMVIDQTIRMYTESVIELDRFKLEAHLKAEQDRKLALLNKLGGGDPEAAKKALNSNIQFAALLAALGADVPMKTSLTTGKETFAFAKSDEGLKALQEHENEEVQLLVAARLGNKSTLEETRTQRFIDISKRGLLPVPVRYYAAHTGRWGGDDKINLQNLPSRGRDGKKLKRSIIAPEGCSLIDCDSSQIEARVLAWLAKQDDLTQAFNAGEDVYKKMASRIYGVPEEDVDKDQRFVGKTTILGAGYGMGAVKFQAQLQGMGVYVKLDEARRIIEIYREANWNINELWRDAQKFLKDSANGDDTQFGLDGVLKVVDGTILLPSGLKLGYADLQFQTTDKGVEFDYKTRRGRTRIYGGKIVENVCQAIARCIIGEQMLQIAKKYRVVLTVHDSIVCCVKDDVLEEAQEYIEKCMRWTPHWADGLPINCESGTGKSYGDCE